MSGFRRHERSDCKLAPPSSTHSTGRKHSRRHKSAHRSAVEDQTLTSDESNEEELDDDNGLHATQRRSPAHQHQDLVRQRPTPKSMSVSQLMTSIALFAFVLFLVFPMFPSLSTSIHEEYAMTTLKEQKVEYGSQQSPELSRSPMKLLEMQHLSGEGHRLAGTAKVDEWRKAFWQVNRASKPDKVTTG